MTYILDSRFVYVVIHLHCGVIFNTAVFKNGDDARDYQHRLMQDRNDDDDIDIQECEIIGSPRERDDLYDD